MNEKVLGVPLAVVLSLGFAGCGGGGSTAPGPLPTPTPTGESVAGLVFYDEDGDGALDTNEVARVPNVEVAIGPHMARSEPTTGRFTVTGVPAGSQTLAVRGAPPYYAAGAPVAVQVPQSAGSEVRLPLTLPIGGNRPNVYMAFGDSITLGDVARPTGNYPSVLQTRLAPHFGDATVTNRGADGTNSFEGVERAFRNLRGSQPAFTLILYGTNDWNTPGCADHPPCETVENLRQIVQTVKGFRSLAFVSTLLPVNPEKAPAGRNDWVRSVNTSIRSMAASEGVFLVDAYTAFDRRGNLPSLFVDHIHPNDTGYAILADSFFQAIAFGREAPQTSGFGAFFAAPFQ